MDRRIHRYMPDSAFDDTLQSGGIQSTREFIENAICKNEQHEFFIPGKRIRSRWSTSPKRMQSEITPAFVVPNSHYLLRPESIREINQYTFTREGPAGFHQLRQIHFAQSGATSRKYPVQDAVDFWSTPEGYLDGDDGTLRGSPA
jgi:hypothetical protein